MGRRIRITSLEETERAQKHTRKKGRETKLPPIPPEHLDPHVSDQIFNPRLIGPESQPISFLLKSVWVGFLSFANERKLFWVKSKDILKS